MPDVCPIGTEIQTLLFPSAKFPSQRDAAEWAIRHGFGARKIHSSKDSHRIRQRPPTRYEPGSFRTIPLGASDVLAVIGCPKQSETKEEKTMAKRKKKKSRKGSKKSGKRRTTRARRRRSSSGSAISVETKHKLDKILGRA